MKHKLRLLFSAMWLFATAASVSASDSVPSVISIVDKETYHEVSFSCELGRSYAFYGSQESEESGKAFWFHIKTVTVQMDTFGITFNEVTPNVATLTLPKPFLSWSTSAGSGFLSIVETNVPTQPGYNVGVTEFKHLGDFVRVTFESVPFQEYMIWGSDDMKDWVPVDTLDDGERQQTFEVIGSLDDHTTIDIPIPFLPWLDPSKGFVKVTTKTASFSRVARLVVAPVKNWMLVCTEDKTGILPLANDGKLGLVLVTSGPNQKDSGKYMSISASCRATRSNPTPFQKDFLVDVPYPMPPDEAGNKRDKLVQVIRLSHYEGDETPTVIFEPDPKQRALHDNILHCSLAIRSGNVIAVAAFDPKEVLDNNIEYEQQGVSVKLTIPSASATCSIQMPWQFSAMDQSTYNEFCKVLNAAANK